MSDATFLYKPVPDSGGELAYIPMVPWDRWFVSLYVNGATDQPVNVYKAWPSSTEPFLTIPTNPGFHQWNSPELVRAGETWFVFWATPGSNLVTVRWSL